MKKWLIGISLAALVTLAAAQLYTYSVTPNLGLTTNVRNGALDTAQYINQSFTALDAYLGPQALQVGHTGVIGDIPSDYALAHGAGVAVEVYNTPLAAATATQSISTLYTTVNAGKFRISVTYSTTVIGTSCGGSGTYVPTLTWTDPNAAGTTTQALATFTISASTGNGAVGTIPYTSGLETFVFNAKAASAIRITNTITTDAGCSPAPTTVLSPIIEAL